MGERLERSLGTARREITEENARSLEAFSRAQHQAQTDVFSRQDKRLAELTEHMNIAIKGVDERMAQMNSFQEKNAQTLRETVDAKLTELRSGNEKSLAEIRQSVDEKLQATLEERISRSFKEVSERLQQVYQGLGEMQTLANGVGDLKKVLSNVKTRGILGEIQLASILEEILSPEQYESNVATVPGSSNRVEFAIRLPGDGDGVVYLPIDSKFPADAYLHLQDAYDAADADQVRAQRSQLESRIKAFAKDIHEKYVSPPATTDFAVMFLPTEGLYAEVVKMGMIETLQRNYKVNIAGPTTMAALLNSLQTGFRTLAIQKRSSEVWEVLSAVRTEFDKFEGALRDAQAKIDQANRGLDALVGVRTRQIQRKLKNVSSLPSERAEELLKEDRDAEE
ncbi:MAG: DNA recombination protein RmuC [Clostridia bacterium]|nr:DNA recombination protein RmuC [Clostridia bacterium]